LKFAACTTKHTAMKKYNVMDEFLKMFVEQVRKSGLSVAILCVGFYGMWNMYNTDKRAMKEEYQLLKLETGLEMKQLRSELASCHANNVSLAVKLAAAEVEIKTLTAAFGRRK